jgi:multimeric flavodoxin WrbA
MKKIVAFNGSPRKNGNSVHLMDRFLKGAGNYTDRVNTIFLNELNLKYCQGCLRCNLLGYCSIRDDAWPGISREIQQSDILVFASPVYFHHVTAQMKTLIDRFRSFIHVALDKDGLQHTPRENWNKDFVLLLTMGSSDDIDAEPIVDLFRFITDTLGLANTLHTIKGKRLAVSNQVIKSEEELKKLYPKLNLEADLAATDCKTNKELLEKCYHLGQELTR